MKAAEACRSACQFLQRGREQFQDIRHEPNVGDLEDRCARIRVDRDDEAGVLHAGDVLHRAADPAGHVEFRVDRLAALTDLPRLREPVHVGERT